MDSKKCKYCGQEKPIESFSINRGMADGRLNKCKPCAVEFTRQRRLLLGTDALKERRRKEYEKALANGTRTRDRSLDQIRLEADPLSKKIIKRRYFHKHRSRAFNPTELDDLVFDEAVRLCVLRQATVGGEWWVDHVVPVKGKNVCGLHNAFNLQVVPRRWNEKKSHIRIGYFFPIYGSQ